MTRLFGDALRSLPAAAYALGTLARPFTPEDLVQTNRLSGHVAVSPSGASIAYVQTHYSIEKKRQYSQLFVQALDARDHLDGRVMVADFSKDSRPNPPLSESADETDAKKRFEASQPVWLTDECLGFVATNAKTRQATVYSVHGSGKHWSKPQAVFTSPVPISDVQYSPVSGILAFTAGVYNGTTTLKETADLDLEEQERADTAQVYDELWVRHWDSFVTPKLAQIHVLQLAAGSDGLLKPKNEPRNIIKDTAGDGRVEASDSFVFSPDGRQIAFVAKRPGSDYAWRTTSYVYVADVDGTAATPINPEGGGASSSPAFSSDGSRIAYLQMAAPTYEADRNQIKVFSIEDKSTIDVAADWDRSPSELLWAGDSTLLATYTDYGRNKLAKVDIASGTITPVAEEHSVGSAQRLSDDKLLISYSAFDSPTDLYTLSIDHGDISRVTQLNPELGSSVFLSPAEDVEFVGTDGDAIHGFLLRPPNFDPAKKYPLAYVIHGGPQSSFADSWSTRWNLNIFAAAGFVTVAMDFEGSTGYGQNFTDAIRNQWGGKPYRSLMLSLDQLLAAHPYIDSERLAALGASYGGYQINWINGHSTRFKALVNHDGMFSTISTYYSTEELYFPETEFEGAPFDPKARENYERWSPERYVQNWKTPTLVIHSERDYRLVVSEGLSTFTALRRQGVPAKLLYYPDENHWVLKPANSLRWHQEVLDWITRWTPEEQTADDSSSNTRKFVVQNEL
ncbi:dipeptidylpeptidase [Coemansia sp. RSA 2706]|nr:dipeptidylpeptidase [Coemansia sp. RSA 2706]KAJ2392291.1 dipeptidylpeptidase [Coemansia sp. RSA 2611]